MLIAPPMLSAAGVPELGWNAPFLALLLCVAVLPLFHKTSHWWHSNVNKLIVSLVCAASVLVHYWTRDFGVHLHGDFVVSIMRTLGFALSQDPSGFGTEPGAAAMVGAALNSAWEYVPFMVMLFSLYTIAGGIVVRGRLPATPTANAGLMALGGLLASLIGTTGASVLLIRPLLKALGARTHKVHTVVFFIFIVSNIGGTMLPIGDPPLFVGFLRGVPFLWTLNLWMPWAFMLVSLLVVYLVWDTLLWKRERTGGVATTQAPRGENDRVSVAGLVNVVWLIAVVLAVATLAPGAAFVGTSWIVPPLVREGVMLAMVVMSYLTTAKGLRAENRFDFFPIAEVAALFLGIFVCLQVPLEILSARGHELGLTSAWQYFWATGILSSFLDNAPTYAVFFQTALGAPPDPNVAQIVLTGGTGGGMIRHDLLAAVSLGSVFMGANTYIGNGPNFMVKAIAEEGGVKMPGFFGYMAYSCAVLVPLFVLLTVVFLA
jgi:Na+/H+ antiporter NhaD/arsenite permease-like protein